MFQRDTKCRPLSRLVFFCALVGAASETGVASAQQQSNVGVVQPVRMASLNGQALEKRLGRLLAKQVHRSAADTYILADRHGKSGVQIQGDATSFDLKLTGNESLVAQVVALIRALDQSPSSPVKAIVIRRIAANDGATNDDGLDLSQQRQPSFVQPVQYVELAQAPGGGALPAPQRNAQNTNSGNGPQIDPKIRDRLRDLGDDVQVEVLPDLDVVILRGRDADIDELAKIIKQIEQMAENAQPQIEVYPLKHVPGEAIAEVIEEIAEEYTGPRQGRVTVTPLSKPNSLLLVGWGNALKATLDLIAKLDQPTDAETELDLISLSNASATDAAQTIEDFFAERGGLGPRVLVTPDRRTNSLIIRAAPRDIQEVRRMVDQLDAKETDSVNRASVFKLQHSLAADLATVLQNALQDAQSGNANARAAALELLMQTPSGERLLRSGDLASINITPSPKTNSLIVTGPTDSVQLLAALIQRLDAPRDSAKLKVFRIRNGDAASLVQTLRSLLLTGETNDDPNLPNTSEDTSLTPLRFSVEERTNSIIAAGSDGDLQIVEALLKRLDEPGGNERMNAVYHLKNAPAVDVARTINEFLRSERVINNAAQSAVSPTQQVEREVVIVPEVVSNKLVLSATPRYFQQINELIERLDEAPAQVMIQVLIGEVALNNAEEFGIEVGLQDSVLFDRSLLGDLLTTTVTENVQNGGNIITTTEDIIQSATNTPGFNFNNFPLGNSGSNRALANSGTVGGQGLSSFAVGRVNNELGFGGLVLSASSENVSILLRALQESRRIEILSRPQIRTLDNQPAFIQVGQVVPFILNSTITQFGQTNSISFRDVGLILGVTPRISPDGTVVMEIDAEKSTIGPEEQGIPISVGNDGTIIRAPTIETTRAQTTVSAATGETIVLGGLITKSNSVTQRSVPYLSSIPVLGDLFKYDSKSNRRSELVLILTPHIIHGPEDNERIKQVEMARMSWCMADVYDLHGDVNYHFQDQSMMFDEPSEVIYPDDQYGPVVQPTLNSPYPNNVGIEGAVGSGTRAGPMFTSPVGP